MDIGLTCKGKTLYMDVLESNKLIQNINLLTRLEKFDQAEKLIEKLVGLGFEELSIFHVGRIRFFQAKYSESEKLLLNYLSYNADSRAGQYYLIWTYVKQGRLELAYRTVKNAVEHHVNDLDIHLVRGHICRKTERFKELDECIQTLGIISPNHQSVLQLKIEYLIDQDKYNESIKMCHKAISQYPENSTFFSLLAKCQYNTEQYSKSKVTTLRALQVNPEDPLSQTLHSRHTNTHAIKDLILFLICCVFLAVFIVWIISISIPPN